MVSSLETMTRPPAMQSPTSRFSKFSRIHGTIINLGAYAIALLIIWMLARDISIRRFAQSLLHARLSLFIPAAIASMLLWFIGDTITYARLFSYLQVPTRFREMLPGTAAHEFLQVVNGVLAGVSLVWFIQGRKRISWLAAGGTLGFLGFVDLQVLAGILLFATLIKPKLLVGIAWYYPAAFLAISCTFATFYSRSRLRIAQWIYGRSLLTAIRQIRLVDYFRLSLIRIFLFITQGLLLYLEMIAFGIRAPFSIVMAMLPIVLIAGALPLAPSGLGTRQAAIVFCFHEFGSRASLLTMALAHSWLVIAIRLVLGFVIGGAIIKKISSLQLSQTFSAEEN